MKDIVLHLDGDAFFASVEQALDPALKGRPVMTGAERGIVAALSYEAKARGITRGMPTQAAKRACPDLVVCASDYRLYQIFSRRATAIMRRFVPVVEEYGVDECFAAIPGGSLLDGERAARAIQEAILRELDVGYSVGVARTKVLAKVGSKWDKPRGITVVGDDVREEMLRQLPVGKLWGIGRRMAPWLMARGIHTAHDLAARDPVWASRALASPYRAIWAELRGIPAMPVREQERERRGSVQKTQTFWPATADPRILWSELARNVERACAKLRAEGLLARGFTVFLKTQAFTYRRATGVLPRPTAFPEEVLAAVQERFGGMYRPGVEYRATGITLWETEPERSPQRPLFGADSPADPGLARLYAVVDRINAHGTKVRLGASRLSRPRERIFGIPLLRGEAR